MVDPYLVNGEASNLAAVQQQPRLASGGERCSLFEADQPHGFLTKKSIVTAINRVMSVGGIGPKIHAYTSMRTDSRLTARIPCLLANVLQLDCFSWRRTRMINLPMNQNGYDTFETTVGKLSARRIQIYPVHFCLGNCLKVILNNFQNNA